MLEPAIDTLLVCSLTAFALLITGVWTDSTLDGVTMTAVAFEQGIPGIGSYLLILCVFFFSITTMFTYSYYGSKCINFLAGAAKKKYLNLYYVITIFIGSDRKSVV